MLTDMNPNILAFPNLNVIPDEKKDHTISFRVGESFKDNLSNMAKAKGKDSISDLVAEYVIEKFTQDLGKLLLLQQEKRRQNVKDIMATL
jgi:predicted CopG family antitoxin